MARLSRAKLAAGFVEMLETHSAQHATKALAAQVIEQKLTGQIDLLVSDIGRELLKTRGQLNAEVVSAHKLTHKVLDDVKAILKRETGAKSVTITESIDTGIRGGLIARTADLEFDLSIASKLKQLEI